MGSVPHIVHVSLRDSLCLLTIDERLYKSVDKLKSCGAYRVTVIVAIVMMVMMMMMLAFLDAAQFTAKRANAQITSQLHAFCVHFVFFVVFLAFLPHATTAVHAIRRIDEHHG